MTELYEAHALGLIRLVKPSEQLAGVALSPDGTKLALDLRRSIQVITLVSGTRRAWRWPSGRWVGNFKTLRPGAVVDG